METQIKFLNKQYLETRIKEFKEVKRNEVRFEIRESDRAFSRSLYIEFYCLGENGSWFKQKTVRISDHAIADCPHFQFIIEPNSILTKKKKQQFVKMLENAIKRSKKRQFKILLNKISTQGENDE